MLSISLKLTFFTAHNLTTCIGLNTYDSISMEAYQQNISLPAKIRVMLVYDKQPLMPSFPGDVSYDEDLVLPNDVLRCRSLYPAATGSYQDIGQYSWTWNNAHLNLDFAARFEILADELITLNPYGSSNTVEYINKYYDLKGRRTTYNSEQPYQPTYGFLGLS